MKKKTPAYIVHHYFKQLDKYSVKMRKELKEDTIHLFRVDVKKLRAFLRMMRSGVTEPEQLKFSGQFKKMYSIAGNIRDRQLFLERIKETGKTYPGGKIQTLKKEIKELGSKRDLFITKKDFGEMVRRIVKHLPVILPGTLVQDFVQQKQDIINGIIAGADYKDKNLHNIRKGIKDIVYISRIFTDDLKIRASLPFRTKAELVKAEDLAHSIGLFNDAGIALSFLKLSEVRKANGKEKEHLRWLRNQWLAEKRKLKKDILQGLPQINLSRGTAGKSN